MNEIIKELSDQAENLKGTACTFWACDGTPENNRIVSMRTCNKCQTIIIINRQVKKLKAYETKNRKKNNCPDESPGIIKKPGFDLGRNFTDPT